MNTSEEKTALRREMLIQRSQLKPKVKFRQDISICGKLENLILTADFQVIHTFLPMKNEINLIPLISKLLKQKKTIISPKSLPKGVMKNLILSSLAETEPGIFGTYHPKNSSPYMDKIDCIIVPALAFSSSNDRLGYGGGYYDRFLSQHSNSLKIGIAYPFQLMPAIPTECHDRKVDRIVTALVE